MQRIGPQFAYLVLERKQLQDLEDVFALALSANSEDAGTLCG